MSAPILAVTFDVGGTLIEPWPSVGAVYAAVAGRHGWPGLSVEVLNRQFATAWRARKAFDYSRAGWAAVVDATFRGLTDRPPSQTFFPALYERFAEPEAWQVFDDVLPALEGLAARGLRLGVISNWDERLQPLLRRLDLADFFEVIVVSCEAGAAKPDEAIFARAADQLRLPREQILHVGDSRDLDERGARAAGLQARWLRRNAAAAGPGPLQHLGELGESLGLQ
jgi:putative hydrolase of the HAD superfamily